MKVLLFVNVKKDKDMSLSTEIINCMKKKDVEYKVFKADSDQSTVLLFDLNNMDAVIVLGGDGTMLHAIREVSRTGIPVFGVNIGHLGFLTEIDYKNFAKALDKIIDHDYYIEERMLLKTYDSKEIERLAVNDICVINHEPGKIISLSVFVNGNFVERFSGDGIIVSSPTGSTGYSMSAGGPIVSPMASCIIVTPICAHSLTSKPLVLCDTDKIKIEVEEDKKGLAILDGQSKIDINDICVEKSNYKAKFIRFKEYNFFDVLSKKFNNNIGK